MPATFLAGSNVVAAKTLLKYLACDHFEINGFGLFKGDIYTDLKNKIPCFFQGAGKSQVREWIYLRFLNIKSNISCL